MRVSKEQAAQNREAIVDTAGKLFRERGIDGVGIGDLMKEAGFSHGGFYNHFPSKEALAGEVCAVAFERSRIDLEDAFAQGSRRRAWKRYVDAYLSRRHRDGAGEGCTAAAFLGDVPRQGPEVKKIFGDGIEAHLALLDTLLPEDLVLHQGTSARAAALRAWSEMVGALTLSRAVVGTHPELADEILETARRSLVA